MFYMERLSVTRLPVFRMFAVYHAAPDSYCEVSDGLFVVTAFDKIEAQQIVEEKLGEEFFNGCVVEELGQSVGPKIVLEFWRQVPTRQPRVRDQIQTPEVATA